MVEGAAYVGSWLYASKYVYRGQIKLLNYFESLPLNKVWIFIDKIEFQTMNT